jgi:ABC-2 type transport system permease protein
MIGLLRIEWLKLRSVRSPWFLLLGGPALVVAGVSGLVVSKADLARSATVATAAAHVGLVSMISLVLGIIVVAGEYRHRTISDTFMSEPRRSSIVIAKLVVASGMGFLNGIISAVAAILAIIVWWKVKGTGLDLSGGDLWRTLVGGVLWNVGFAAIGVGVGALVRNLAASIAVALVWIALVEGVVGQLVGDLARWLPLASGTALGKGPALASRTPVTQVEGAITLAVYAAVLAAIALMTSVRRDVS